MAYQITYDGNIGALPITATDHFYCSVSDGYSITGTRSIRVGHTSTGTWARFRFVTSTSSPAVSMWLYLIDNAWTLDADAKIQFHLESGEYVGLYWNATNKTFDLYVNGSKVADGTIYLSQQALFNVRVYGTIGNAGSLTVKINGQTSISYSGDTQPGASDQVDYVYMSQTHSDGYIQVSSLSLNDGGTDPSDRRAQVLMPTADGTVQWTPSTGTDNYAMVDEVPPSDTDYNEADTTGEKDLLALADFDGTEKTIAGVTVFARAWKTTADAQSLKVGAKAGTTEDSTEHALEESALYLFHGMGVNPDDSAAWEDADIDALQVLLEAVIP